MKFVLSIILCVTGMSAGGLKYPVSVIPADMTSGVNAVVREDIVISRIYSQSKGGLYGLYAVTIFNEKGNHFAKLALGYDKLSRINKFSGAVYDATGSQIKKLKNSDIIDRSAYDGFSLYTDNRIKEVDLSQSTFPYTVEFEYETETKFLYSIGGSVIIPGEKVSVQHSSYKLIYPPDLKPHVKTLNIENQVAKVEKTSDGNESMYWSFSNVKPMRFEPLGPDRAALVPTILAAPGNFEYDGYEGNMASWEEYGRWNFLLNQGRDVLPEATKQKVRELTNGLKTQEEKIKVLYQYLQGKTRYVSIQLGIGGLQPFPALTVDQTGYGDCKALSNYMVAMLKEAGIKGYYTTVRAGEDESPIIVDFPSHQSNHAIVAVPNGVDTIWLECTSQTNPFGYQGTFTGDRKALMITENGGKLVNTIRYSEEQNKQSCAADVSIKTDGSAEATTRTIYSGLQFENDNLDVTVDRSYDDQKKWIQRNTDIPSFDVISFSMMARKDKLPSATVAMKLSMRRFATVSGKRLFLTPNLMNRIRYVPEKVEVRETDVYRKRGYTDLDTIRYSLPEELYPEFLPEPISIKSRFGEYLATFKLEQGKVVYARKVIMKKGVFPPESYNELIDFYKKISKADNTKLVFLNKT